MSLTNSAFLLKLLPLLFSVALAQLLTNQSWAQETPPSKEAITPDKNQPLVKKSLQQNPYIVQQQRQAALALTVKQQKLVWLKTSNGNWLSLYLADETGKDRGIVIIVPDDSRAINQVHALNQLAINLPQHGWSTLVVGMPLRNTRTTSSSKRNNIEAKSREDRENLKLDLLQKALATISPSERKNIVLLLHGENATLLTKAILAKLKGLVLLNLVKPDDILIPTTIPFVKIPILELAGSHLYKITNQQLKKRKLLALAAKVDYQQILYNSADINFSKLTLNLKRTVNAWLDKKIGLKI